MSKLRYLATYQGPSYGGWDSYERMDGFNSLYEAECEMHRRQTMGYGYVTTYAKNLDDLYVPWELDRRYDFPGSTSEDTMELYKVNAEGGMWYRHEDPSVRLSIGPRGGIVKEKY